MAPRRSTARAASATPISTTPQNKRSIRGESLIAPDFTKRRTTRVGSQQPPVTETDINNPRLPEVQIQQSYAYGSSKTAVLPTQLIARKRMNLEEIANTIDAGVEQAQENLQYHLEEAHAYLQSDARSERAQRRASRERSREVSVASDDAEKQKTQRVAAWADSLDSSQLDEIPEEDSSSLHSNPDDASHKDTDPSSFPSGIFDHSYNYERGLRRPNITIREKGEPLYQKAISKISSTFDATKQASRGIIVRVSGWIRELLGSCGQAICDLPRSSFISSVLVLLVGLLLASISGLLFCYAYTNHVCDPFTTSSIGRTLQNYCGTCVRHHHPVANLTASQGDDLKWLNNALQGMDSRMRSLELQINNKIAAEHENVVKELEALRKQYVDLSAQSSKSGNSQGVKANDVASPVLSKVNYFALSNGAQIYPRLTSPTKQKPLGPFRRLALGILGSTLYQTSVPEIALSSWHDVGDCWCASAVPREQDSMRLAVKTGGRIFPRELVVENHPSGGSLTPGTTPKDVEVWADFGHLDSVEWEQLNIRKMQGAFPLGPTYALVGRATYDASEEVPHVQAFGLDVNQDVNLYHAETFVIRVISNYGSDHTCLYRVRLHGSPVPEEF